MVSVTGGDKLAKRLAEVANSARTAESVSVGFLEGATYPESGVSVAMVAAIQEYGAPSRGIPPRPFFRTMIATKSPEWPEAIGKMMERNNFDAYRTLDALGDQIAGQLKESIIAVTSPPLSPITVMLRGMKRQSKFDGLPFGKLMAMARARVAAGKTNYGASTKPLEDTRIMLGAVAYVVK